jgi:hypothetical protein
MIDTNWLWKPTIWAKDFPGRLGMGIFLFLRAALAKNDEQKYQPLPTKGVYFIKISVLKEMLTE